MKLDNYLISNGFKKVYVIDIAKLPLDNLKKRNPEFQNHFIHDDFFNLNEKFDLVIEQTFFCALSPELREKYAQKMSEIINPNGKLVGLLFNFPLTTEGPPFGGCKEEYLALFENRFNIKILEKAYNSIKPRADKELFIIFEKK